MKPGDNLNREELFDKLKDECRSSVKWRLCVCAIVMLVVLAFIYWDYISVIYPQERIRPLCVLPIFCIAAIWFAVDNLRFLHRIKSIDTPEQLLHWHEKRINSNRNAYYLFILGCICFSLETYAVIIRDWWVASMNWTIIVIMVVVLIYSYFKGDMVRYKTDREEDITDQLQDLVNKK